VQDRDLRIVATNENFIETFGDARGRFCYEVYKQSDDKCADCPVERTFSDGRKHSTEQNVVLPDGNTIPILAYTAPVHGPNGEIEVVVEISADIAPVKRLEAKLRESRERFRLLFEEVPCYISVQDRDLNIVQTNRSFKEDFGDYVGASCFEVYKHRGEPCLKCPVAATFHDGERHYSEEVVTSLDGRQIHTLVSTAPIKNAKGEIEQVMEMSTNITQIRELQGQLTNLGLLVGSISHGVKGLLTGLDGGMYLLSTGMEKNKPERVQKGWKMIRRNVEHIRSVVLDLLYIAKEREPQFEPVALNELASLVVEMLQKRAEDLEIDFQVDLDAHVGTCEVDPKAIKESLVNILDNAFDACRVDNRKDSHFVHLSLVSEGDDAVFRIEDNGVGMDRETREKMFSLFFSSKGVEGTGLGLFTANKVIEKHRGVIEVDSEPGKGTSFTIRIPKVRDQRVGA
jgi:PAS domain S-box-containing protein